jgi:transcriptional regulator with XRE-family HTH domain
VKRATVHTPEHEELVLLLHDLRLKSGLTQAEAAAALERPQTYVSAVEVGRRGIDLVQVREFCRIYGVTFPTFATLYESYLDRRESQKRPPRLTRRSS